METARLNIHGGKQEYGVRLGVNSSDISLFNDSLAFIIKPKKLHCQNERIELLLSLHFPYFQHAPPSFDKATTADMQCSMTPNLNKGNLSLSTSRVLKGRGDGQGRSDY